MKYGPEDLKRISDELLGDFEPSICLRQKILSICASSMPATASFRQKRRLSIGGYLTCAAAALLVCAITAIGVGWAMQSHVDPYPLSASNLDANQANAVFIATQQPSDQFVQMGADQSAPSQAESVAASLSPAVTVIPTKGAEIVSSVGSDNMSMILTYAQDGSLCCSFTVKQADNGLFGITDNSGLWIVQPKYNLAFFTQDGSAVLQYGSDSTILAPQDLLAFSGR